VALLYQRTCNLLSSLISPSSLILLMAPENLSRDVWRQSPACWESPIGAGLWLESWASLSIRPVRFKWCWEL